MSLLLKVKAKLRFKPSSSCPFLSSPVLAWVFAREMFSFPSACLRLCCFVFCSLSCIVYNNPDSWHAECYKLSRRTSNKQFRRVKPSCLPKPWVVWDASACGYVGFTGPSFLQTSSQIGSCVSASEVKRAIPNHGPLL